MAKLKYSKEQIRKNIEKLLGRSVGAEEALQGPERQRALQGLMQESRAGNVPVSQMVEFEDYGLNPQNVVPGTQRTVRMPQQDFLRNYLLNPQRFSRSPEITQEVPYAGEVAPRMFGPGKTSSLRSAPPVYAVESTTPGGPEDIIGGLKALQYRFGKSALPKSIRDAYARVSESASLDKLSAATEAGEAWDALKGLKVGDKKLKNIWEEIYNDSMETLYPAEGPTKVHGVIRRLKGEPSLGIKGEEASSVKFPKTVSEGKPSQEAHFKDTYFKYKTDPGKWYRKYEREFDFFGDIEDAIEKRMEKKGITGAFKDVAEGNVPPIPEMGERLKFLPQEPFGGKMPIGTHELTGPGIEEASREAQFERLPAAQKKAIQDVIRKKERVIAMIAGKIKKGESIDVEKFLRMMEAASNKPGV